MPASLSLLLVAALTAPTPGVAEPVDLRWDGPDVCPAATFRDALARHLAAAPPGPPPVVRVRVREQPDGRWQLDLDLAGGAAAGARQLVADRCDTVVDAAAFVVAQALDPATAGASPPDAVVPVAPDEPSPTPDLAGAPEPVPAPPFDPLPAASAAPRQLSTPPGRAAAPPRVRGALRLQGGLSGGALPAVGAELGLAAAILGARWRAELLLQSRLPARRRAPEDPSVGAAVGLWVVGARGCGVPGVRRLEFPLCLGVEVGQVSARSFGLPRDGRSALVWTALTAAPGLMWRPNPTIALSFQVELAVPLLRHAFVIEGLAPIVRVGPALARAVVGIEWRFP